MDTDQEELQSRCLNGDEQPMEMEWLQLTLPKERDLATLQECKAAKQQVKHEFQEVKLVQVYEFEVVK